MNGIIHEGNWRPAAGMEVEHAYSLGSNKDETEHSQICA
jgi:hypothetical protein